MHSRALGGLCAIAVAGVALKRPGSGHLSTDIGERRAVAPRNMVNPRSGDNERACAECHMPDPPGTNTQVHSAGYGFQLKWQDASVAEPGGRIRSMPLGRPGRPTSQEYLDIPCVCAAEERLSGGGQNELTGAGCRTVEAENPDRTHRALIASPWPKTGPPCHPPART